MENSNDDLEVITFSPSPDSIRVRLSELRAKAALCPERWTAADDAELVALQDVCQRNIRNGREKCLACDLQQRGLTDPPPLPDAVKPKG
jgi:hypothetical protein